MNLCKFKDALRDFRIVMKRSPDDKDAKAKFTECEKIVKRMAFEKAIEVDSPKNLAETFDVNTIVVEPSYDGPKLEDGKITKEFIEEMMERFKNQKRIHKKHAFQVSNLLFYCACCISYVFDIIIWNNGKIITMTRLF